MHPARRGRDKGKGWGRGKESTTDLCSTAKGRADEKDGGACVEDTLKG